MHVKSRAMIKAAPALLKCRRSFLAVNYRSVTINQPWATKFLSSSLFRGLSYTVSTSLVDSPAISEHEGLETEASVPLVLLDVGGMKCGGCSAAVKRMLSARPDVESAAVNLITETAAVRFRGPPGLLASEAVAMLTAKGFPSKIRSSGMGEPVSGADASAAALETEQRREEDARTSLINLGVAWGLVSVCCIHHLGHLLHVLGQHSYAHSSFMMVMGNPWLSGLLGAAALVGPGRQLLADGFSSLVNGNPNMNSLVALGCTASFSVGSVTVLSGGSGGFDASFLEEPVMLLAFVLLGRALEARAKVTAASDLKSLAQLIPATSRMVLDPGGMPSGGAAKPSSSNSAGSNSNSNVEYMQVSTSTIRPGDIVRVLPGEKIPVDGVIIEGRCCVDESALTGEPHLVPKDPGSSVTGGTVSYEGAVTVRATSTGQSSTLAGIARLVSDAQSREAPVQRLADAVAGRFCYGVMAASAATFLFWSIVGVSMFPGAVDDATFAEPMSSWAAMSAAITPSATTSTSSSWAGLQAVGLPLSESSAAGLLLSIRLAVDVLVVACPCALGLATPTAVLVASSLGARKGLLIRGGDILEKLASVNTVVLDKTGTLTQGKLDVVSVSVSASVRASGMCEEEVLRLAAATEAVTRHPLADAVLREAAARGLQLPSAEEPKTVPGSEGTSYLPSGTSHVSTSDSFSSAPGTSHIWVGALGKGVLGMLSLRDTLREDAESTVKRLRDLGMTVQILSGDNNSSVAYMAQRAGVDHAQSHGDMSPKDKLAHIEKLKAGGSIVAMVGDGVNDTPALAAANVGIAMKGGLDAASEAASVVLMGDRLSQVVDSLELGRSALNKIKQNLAWALAYNLVGIPLAAGALLPSYGICLNPSVAAGMMAFSSVAVVSNSLLLRSKFSPQAHAIIEAGKA
ncbi:hypothetical protein CEUSTIGMA_g124.t1 [Chlamydomonas eustigma]|uniref:HMA domain-containing protein n=1 Tax=Chlamydomonas eustigma TaxID=1157962 RepID=A0A250WPB2_9CHLO|nr:hypothetical protein CEUSTIGMA_g124.t1 [Chlamydomonas eustigma]|eukprot:GAX72668.1 hypothetical protein CEUSTIGMA_g124.t1 [Chlamydomonas eustigma]